MSNIEKALVKFPKAKKIAVQNFVCSARDNKRDNAMNLSADTRAYSWAGQTVNAIKFALKLEGKI